MPLFLHFSWGLEWDVVDVRDWLERVLVCATWHVIMVKSMWRFCHRARHSISRRCSFFLFRGRNQHVRKQHHQEANILEHQNQHVKAQTHSEQTGARFALAIPGSAFCTFYTQILFLWLMYRRFPSESSVPGSPWCCLYLESQKVVDGLAKIGLFVRGFVPACSEFHQRECRPATCTRESDTVLSDGFVTVGLQVS